MIYINLSYNNQPKNDIENKTLKLEFDLLDFVIEKVNNVMGDASNYDPCPKTYKRTQRNTSIQALTLLREESYQYILVC